MLALASSIVLFGGQKSPPSTWSPQNLTSGFSVSAPIKLDKIAKKIVDRGMAKIDAWAGHKERCSFVVGVSLLKDPIKTQTSRLLSASAEGLVSQPGCIITSEKDLLLQGWQGLALTKKSNEGTTTDARYYRCGDFMVDMVCTYVTADPRPADIDRFLGSLHAPNRGRAVTPGPQMTRFPLGDSGLTVLFPREPKHTVQQVGAGLTKESLRFYLADYALRSFGVVYRDIPLSLRKSATSVELFRIRTQFTDEMVRELHFVRGKQRDDLVGADKALSTDIAVKGQSEGKLVVFVHGSKIVYLLELAPPAYSDPKLVNRFLHSVEVEH